MNTRIDCRLILGIVALIRPAAQAEQTIRQMPGQAEVGWAEIHGLTAGEFDPNIWKTDRLNIVPDVRSPMIAPETNGVFRNIYAPSAVEIPGGWELFYGAWDGVNSGNDRIYSIVTPDFLTFARRGTIIDHGAFIHVCNVSAVRETGGEARLMCTAYPVGADLNKPASFRTRLSEHAGKGPAPSASQPAEPIQAEPEHLVSIEGYEPFAAADMNGVNALLLEDRQYRLYFGDFKNWGHVHRASSTDGRHFRYDGKCLPAALMVNDVKKFTPAGRPCYLMGLHANRERLWYALSDDGMTFAPQRELAVSLGAPDRYIVAIGWVTRGERLLGFVYGAGAVPELNRNRLFARWLQKKVVFTDESGKQYPATAALGPDRAMIPLGDAKQITGKIQVFAEDGQTHLCEPQAIKLRSGAVYSFGPAQP